MRGKKGKLQYETLLSALLRGICKQDLLDSFDKCFDMCILKQYLQTIKALFIK